jgi:hypothetical protein
MKEESKVYMEQQEADGCGLSRFAAGAGARTQDGSSGAVGCATQLGHAAAWSSGVESGSAAGGVFTKKRHHLDHSSADVQGRQHKFQRIEHLPSAAAGAASAVDLLKESPDWF